VSTDKGHIHFTWQSNSGLGKAHQNDMAILVVLCPDRQECVYTLEGGYRSDGAAELPVPLFSGYEVQTWLSFLSKDRKDIASSLFTGSFVVA
jgi:hypothetical protein